MTIWELMMTSKTWICSMIPAWMMKMMTINFQLRRFISFPIADHQQIKQQMLNWGNRFNICCFLDNHNYHFSHHSIECVLAAGSVRRFNTLHELSEHYQYQ